MMWLIIGIVYFVLTGIAINIAVIDGTVFEPGATIKEKIIRTFFLLAIGWFVTLCLSITVGLVSISNFLTKQFIEYDEDPNSLSISDWLKKYLKRLIPWKKKKEGAKKCSTDSQTEQKKSCFSPTKKPIDLTMITSGQNMSSLDLSKKEAASPVQSSETLE